MGGVNPRLRVMAPAARTAERRYVLDLILTEWLGLSFDLAVHDEPRTTIARADDPAGRTISLPEILFATDDAAWLTERSMPGHPVHRLRVPPEAEPDFSSDGSSGPGRADPGIPAIYAPATVGEAAWDETAEGLRFGFDLLGSAFWLVTRYEEAVVPDRDRHGRVPAAACLAVKEGFEDRPIADEYADLLWAAMRRLWPAITRPEATFRLRLTHDIDQPWAAFGRSRQDVARGLLGDLGRRRDPGLALRRLRSVVDARSGRADRDPFNVFDFLMDTSEGNGLRSTFYVMAGNAPGDDDFRYRLTDAPFGPILRRIHERGHEIGLHASYGSFGDPDRLLAEFEALRATCRAAGVDQPAWGVRQHYLRFAVPGSWRHQAAAGLAHDSSVGFAERPGFRSGTCREYPVFDIAGRERLDLRERPLVVMDTTLIEYLAASEAEAVARTRTIVAACRRHRGDAVLLFHNDALASRRSRSSYRSLIEALRATDGPGEESMTNDRGGEAPGG